jgi:hypothetical protein
MKENFAMKKPALKSSGRQFLPSKNIINNRKGTVIQGRNNRVNNSYINNYGYGYGGTYGLYNSDGNSYQYSSRPYRYWTNYVYPSMYQTYPTSYPSYYPYGYYPMAYGIAAPGYYDPYDYTNVYPPGNVCWSKIGIEDAFGPYTAGVMGKQAWLDFGGRNGFDKVALNTQSVTNDHAILSYVGQCNPQQTTPPGPPYQIYNSTPQYY